jgi:hypothetical protein
MTGPDLVWECKTEENTSVIFLARAKLPPSLSLGKAFYSVSPDNLYKNKNGKVLGKNRSILKEILARFSQAVLIVELVVCYPHTAKSDNWKNHVLLPSYTYNTRSSPSKQAPSRVKILVDARNALSFFGEKQLDLLKLAQEEAKFFGINSDAAINESLS